MDSKIRGFLDNFIDALTGEEGLTASFQVIRKFKPAVKSVQDAVFGYIVGLALCNFTTNYQREFDRLPNTVEIETFDNVILDRASNIMSKIRDFANR